MSTVTTIAGLAAIFSAAENILTALIESRKALQQSGEWTAEQEAQFDLLRRRAYKTSAFKTDAQLEAERNAATGGEPEAGA